nr:MAG TPA: hypothetical protein [Caudoviricetes sp.]
MCVVFTYAERWRYKTKRSKPLISFNFALRMRARCLIDR